MISNRKLTLMHHLILDTCIWSDLAEFDVSIISKIDELLKEDVLTILVPELVKSEWEKGTGIITEKIQRQIRDLRQSSLSFLSLLDGVIDSETHEKIQGINPQELGAKIASERIQGIEKIMNSGRSILLPTSQNAFQIAAEHALNKKAPFRGKNSMADALIFFSFIEWIEENKPQSVFFVTTNINDYSDIKRDEDVGEEYKHRLSEDLQIHADKVDLKYRTIIGKVLNEIKESMVSETEIKRSEAHINHTKELESLQSLVSLGALAASQEGIRVSDFIPAAALEETRRKIAEQHKMIKASDFIPTAALEEILRKAEEEHKISDQYLNSIKVNDFIPTAALEKFRRKVEEQQNIGDKFTMPIRISDYIPTAALEEIQRKTEQQNDADKKNQDGLENTKESTKIENEKDESKE